jgi:hypothetical protein
METNSGACTMKELHSKAKDCDNPIWTEPDGFPTSHCECDQLDHRVLILISQNPGLDDEEMGDKLGVTPYLISKSCRRLAEAGYIQPRTDESSK